MSDTGSTELAPAAPQKSNQATGSTLIPLPWLLASWGVLAGASTLGSVFAPYLSVNYPLLLVAMSPWGRHLLLVTPLVDFWALLIVVVVRRTVSALLFYSLGQAHGDNAIAWLGRRWPSLAEGFAMVEKIFDRFNYPLVVVGGLGPWLLAGSTRMPFRFFLPTVIAGTAMMVIGATLLGDLFEAPIRYVLDLFRNYVWEATAVLAAFVLAFQAPKAIGWLRARSEGAE